MKKTKPEVVESIIDLLSNKSGFDDWWYSIDEETQHEIKEELANELN